MKNVAIIQARATSTRLPGKVLLQLGSSKVIDWVFKAASQVSGIDEVVIATSADSSDDELAEYCKRREMPVFRGPLDDVLERMYLAAENHKADRIMRITADCPFLDPIVASTLVLAMESGKYDYAANINPPTFPDGLDCELITKEALRRTMDEATLSSDREHVTVYIRKNRSKFKIYNLNCAIHGAEKIRLTLDTQDDMTFLSQIAKEVKNPNDYIQVLHYIQKNPACLQINAKQIRDSGSVKSLQKDKPQIVRSFKRSAEILQRAEKSIPLGSQTFSKSRVQYPVGHAPLFVSHGYKGKTWDVDGNQYVDLVNALMPNVLGYCDPDVNEAIQAQLNNGICFSLPTELEYQLAEKMIEIIPCAESVRFGKNGSDATSGCIRLARAFTGREKVMVCGYHGWQDWYIGSTTRNKGVPKAVSALTFKVEFNNLNQIEDTLKKNPNEFAALIMEPMNVMDPAPGFLEGLKALLQKYGTLLIFDEIITGFRYSLGGAQEYFKVTPDLASFGKSMGNGMPISAIVGRKDIMAEMENVFFSGTFGGETLSLAAALATIRKMEKEKVISKLWETGAKIRQGVNVAIKTNKLENILSVQGKDPWTLLGIKPPENVKVELIKTFILHELHKSGILTVGSHNICYSHDETDIADVISAYEMALDKLKQSLGRGSLAKDLVPPPIIPVFQVRG